MGKSRTPPFPKRGRAFGILIPALFTVAILVNFSGKPWMIDDGEYEPVSDTDPRASLDLLQQQRDYQAFFCSDVHPIPLDNANFGYFENFKLVDDAPAIGMYLFKQGDIVSNHIIGSRTWEPGAITDIAGLMAKAKEEHGIADPVFLDIGSNVGWLSVNIAARGYKTISFDALLNNGRLFRSTLCQNPALMERITFVNKGLASDEKVCLDISEGTNQGDGNTVCPEGNPADYKPPGNYHVRNELHLVRLDDYVKQDIVVLKIDVEGFELHVLNGAERLFTEYNVHYIISEVCPRMMGENGRYKAEEYFDLLVGYGYEIMMDGPDGKVVTRREEFSERGGLFNIFCRNKYTTRPSASA